MNNESDTEDNGIFKYRRKILKMKLLFASGVGTICMLAGFKYGYSKSKAKHASSEILKDKTLEDPVKFAGRALKRATLITVGCFAVGIGVISIGFGIHSLTDLRNISRRKWMNKDKDSQIESSANIYSADLSIESETHIVYQNKGTEQGLDNEVMVDKAEELTDKWS